jgi:ubiquinone/menaquinone biosynthesis C-methylase UbiE
MIDRDRLTRWYNAQAKFYSARRDSFDGGHVRCVAEALDSAARLRILDAACGTGLFSIGLARLAPGWRLEGVDRAEKMLEVGRERAAKLGLANVTFTLGDVEALSFDDAAFDVVIASGLLPNLNQLDAAFREIRRVLRPDGRLFIVEIDREALTFADRLSFRTLVWGYRVISTMLPRFKFARGWSLERSTVDPADVENELRTSGLLPRGVRRVDKHWIIEACKRT